ncbi:MAG: hypothetical protein Q7K13_07180 [Polynucleobacter sp.]|uniref:hypothetical protein n=1 Tax=Polynucleobacter sp. TaxID=2029855 RepID=UPI00271C1BFC|nr:hypothetical protein [Polynucleobacter sp.]MDO8714243.1 hypothetical protein [Polynucleobacter sp.]
MPTKTLWMEFRRDTFVNAIKQLKPQTKVKKFLTLELEISFNNGEACFDMGGLMKKIPASAEWDGYAVVPMNFIFSFTKIQPSNDPVRIEFIDQKFKIETSKVSSKWSAQSTFNRI